MQNEEKLKDLYDELDVEIGEDYADTITGKTYTTLMVAKGEYKNSREHTLLDKKKGKLEKKIIFSGK